MNNVDLHPVYNYIPTFIQGINRMKLGMETGLGMNEAPYVVVVALEGHV